MSTTVSTSTLLDSIRRVLGWLGVIMVFFATNVFAGQVNLAWNASTGPVAGYLVYYGTTSGTYTISR